MKYSPLTDAGPSHVVMSSARMDRRLGRPSYNVTGELASKISNAEVIFSLLSFRDSGGDASLLRSPIVERSFSSTGTSVGSLSVTKMRISISRFDGADLMTLRSSSAIHSMWTGQDS